MKRENWPPPYLPLTALFLVGANLILGEVLRALLLAGFSVVTITIGTAIGNVAASRRK